MSKFMTGLLLGVGVGLLLAPEKGEDTREALVDTAEQWKTKWNKMVGKAESKVDDLKALLGSEISGLSEDVRNRILSILDEQGEGAGASANGNGGGRKGQGFKEEYKPV